MEKKARYKPGRRPARGTRLERVAECKPAGRPVRAPGPSLLRVMTIELVASFVFFLAFVLAASQPGAGLLTPFAVAAVYGALLASLEPRGFVNPSVALAAALGGLLSVRLLVAVWFCQLLAAWGAGHVAVWILNAPDVPALVPREGAAFWAELIFGAGLCLVVLARVHKRAFEAGISAGLFLVGADCVTAAISGAVFNPAAAWTLILADMLDRNSLWIYALAGIGSACAAAALTLRPRSRSLQRTKSNPQDPRSAQEGTVPSHSHSQFQ